jgi:hypothetical protein
MEPEWAGLFDFSTPHIQNWEVDCIQAAARDGSLLMPAYAREKARERSIPVSKVRDAVRAGKATEKDLPSDETRDPGIAFEHSIELHHKIKVKVGFLGCRYSVITAHDV